MTLIKGNAFTCKLLKITEPESLKDADYSQNTVKIFWDKIDIHSRSLTTSNNKFS